MAQASVSLDTGATLNGRALARTGAVSLLSNPVNVPPCPGGMQSVSREGGPLRPGLEEHDSTN